MKPLLLLCVSVLVLVPAAAHAAATVIGTGRARACYEAALLDRASNRTIELCDQAIREEVLAQEDLVATYVNRGILKMMLERIDAAIADFDKATSIDAKEPEAYLNKGVALMRRSQGGGWREAKPLFDAAIARNTRKPEVAYFGRAVANEVGGNIEAAYEDYKRASEIAPGWDLPRKELARFQVVQKPGG